MPALITAYRGGKAIGRCDATCYTARVVSADRCRCVCGGANHGVGLSQAFENTHALQGDWRVAYRKTRKGAITFKTLDQLDILYED